MVYGIITTNCDRWMFSGVVWVFFFFNDLFSKEESALNPCMLHRNAFGCS